MIINGLTLAVLTTTGLIILYKKIPRKVRRFIERHHLLADAVALLFTYILLGGTLTALFAAALVGLFTSALLYIANNPENFMYLYDLRDAIKDKLNELKAKLNELGMDYRTYKQNNVRQLGESNG